MANKKAPDGWTTVRVKRVGRVQLGRQRSSTNPPGTTQLPYLRAGNITPRGLDLSDVLTMAFTRRESKVYGLQSGDVLLAEASGSPAHVGRPAIWRDEVPGCCFQNTVIRFRPHATTSEYALVVFAHFVHDGTFARAARGIGILHLGATRFAELKFPLPPLREQERIAAAVTMKVSELRDGEASLRSALARTHEQEIAILAAACTGNLVEPEATLASRERRGFDSGANLLARYATSPSPSPIDAATMSSLARLPPGWTWTRIGDVGEVTLGKKREPKNHRGSHMRMYLRVANVLEDRIDTSDVHQMNFTPAEEEVYLLRPGDILLNEGQSPELLGRPAMFRGELARVCFQMTLLRFRSGPAVDPEYSLLVFRHYLHNGEFRRAGRGTTNIAHLSRRRFVAIPFPLPPLEEQKRIVAEARYRLGASSAQAASIRSSLERLPTLLGEVYSDAVAGRLVPRNPVDEPAERMLDRLGEPPVEVPEPVVDDEDELQEASMASEPRTHERTDLLAVVKKAGRAIPVHELFSRAGYDRDSIDDVEQFYIRLRADIGPRLAIDTKTPRENAMIKVRNASR